MRTGLCSITFRELSVEEIVNLTVEAKLDGIEWGGDVHVPPGDFAKARNTAEMTKQAGLNIVSYGSYYRVGCKEENTVPFEEILQTAVALKAPSIRVWAGNRGSQDADSAHWGKVVSDSRKIAAMAGQKGIFVSFEYHGGTLTDTNESACRLMKEVDHPNMKIYWQPAVGRDPKKRLQGLKEIEPWLTHVHVFHWKNRDRLSLEEGTRDWERYLQLLIEKKEDRYFLLEFVRNDDPKQFLRDSRTLRRLVSKYE